MEREPVAEIEDRSNVRPNEPRSSARTEQIEVHVRPERHRRWRPEERLRIVQETLLPGAVISAVARQHGIGTGLLYTWRKELLTTAVTGFVPVKVEPEPDPVVSPSGPAAAMKTAVMRTRSAGGRIEIEFPHGIRVRLDGEVDEAALRCVLAVLDNR
jgi:transposase